MSAPLLPIRVRMTDSVADPVEAPFGEPSRPVFGSTRAQRDPAEGAGLQGRLAVVTGASGLLGGAIARRLCERGADVALLGRDLPALDETVRRCGPGAHTAVLQCDLAVSEDVVAAVDFVRRIDRPVDLVVHAAGLQAPARIADGPVEGLDEHYLLNVRGPYLLSQQLLPLVRDGQGRFAFVASAPRPGARGGDVHHVITQAAGRALAAELRVESVPRGIGVVSVVAEDETAVDGLVDADRFASALAANLVDALAEVELDVTELRVRGITRPIRHEQR
jgi:NAD(P)-dependent dehydrogenase (short-subunit alcohol dehydrogenase family)